MSDTPPTSVPPATPSTISRFNRVVIPALIIVALVVFGLSTLRNLTQGTGANSHREEGEAERLGSVVPDVGITEFGKTESVLLSQVMGKVTLVNFWATWCEACIVEMPSIRKLNDAFADQGFKVLAVNLDEEPGAAVTKAIKDFRMNFGVFLDPEQQLSDYFDIHSIPFTAILDKNRKVLLTESGERDWNSSDVREKIALWLKEP